MSTRNFLFTGNTLTYLYPLEQIFDSAVKSQEKMTLSPKLWDADIKLPAAWNWVKTVLKKTANLIFWALLRKMALGLAVNQFIYPKLIEWIELWNKSKVSSLALVYAEPWEWMQGSRTWWPPQRQQLRPGWSASLYHKENPVRNQHLQGGEESISHRIEIIGQDPSFDKLLSDSNRPFGRMSISTLSTPRATLFAPYAFMNYTLLVHKALYALLVK